MRTHFGLDCQAVRHHRFGVNWCRSAGLISAVGLFWCQYVKSVCFLFFGGRVRAGEPTFSLPLSHPLTACPFLFGAAVTPPKTGGEFWIVLLASVACMVAELFKLLPCLRGGPFRGRGESWWTDLFSASFSPPHRSPILIRGGGHSP